MFRGRSQDFDKYVLYPLLRIVTHQNTDGHCYTKEYMAFSGEVWINFFFQKLTGSPTVLAVTLQSKEAMHRMTRAASC